MSKLKAPGRYSDGGGLYLQITKNGQGELSRSWVFRFRGAGSRVREMGLGSTEIVALADARDAADTARKLMRTGTDPIDARRREKSNAALAAASAMSFRQCAVAYIAAHEDSWKSAKHARQWPSTLETYVYPVCGKLSVQDIDVGLVVRVLEPIWKTKSETATRVRQRIEAILDWAAVRGYRSGDNPARWRGRLEKVLPSPSKLRKVRHHPALPFGELPAFMRNLEARDGAAASALRFLILTAGRTSEVLHATWGEIDLEEAVWTVPADRMKAGREHRVPLSPEAVAVLKARSGARKAADWIFPGGKAGRPLSNMALLAVLKRMGHDTIVAHGFRSTFRDWVAEKTNHPREVAEAALAHTLSNKVEAAYRRGDLFEKRRRLMEEWAGHCSSTGAAHGRRRSAE